jgi:ribonuclease D
MSVTRQFYETNTMVTAPPPAPVRWISSPGDLDAWLAARPDAMLALDTEFERVSTFFPIPGLVQLGLDDDFCLVDPSVAEQSTGFRSLLADPERPKLLYAMSEDLELFRHWLSLEPAGLLDLQIGAALAGAGFSVGYARLVETLFNEALDKSATRSDWLSRPLSARQERYALDDVRFLKPLYHWVLEGLDSKGLAPALAEESARFARDLASHTDAGEYYLKIRGGWQLSPSSQAVLQTLASWRETECRHRDRPRNRVLSDPLLIAIADRMPTSTGELASIRDMPPVVVRRYGDWLLQLVNEGHQNKQPAFGLVDAPLTRDEQGLYKQVKRALASVAESHDVPIESLSPRRRLEAIIRTRGEGGAADLGTLLEGWRGDLIEPARDHIQAILAA